MSNIVGIYYAKGCNEENSKDYIITDVELYGDTTPDSTNDRLRLFCADFTKRFFYIIRPKVIGLIEKLVVKK